MSFHIIINNTIGRLCVCVCPLEMAAATKPPFWFGTGSRTVLEHIKKYSASYFNLSMSRKNLAFFSLQIDFKGARSCVVSGLGNLKCSYGWLSMGWFPLAPHILSTSIRISESCSVLSLSLVLVVTQHD